MAGLIILNLISQFLFFFIVFTYIIFIGIANSDLIDGRFSLHVDEQILFDGVRKILNPDSKTQFLYLLFDGSDHRYGRLFWNINAILGYLLKIFMELWDRFILVECLVPFFNHFIHYFYNNFFQKLVFRLLTIITLLAMPYTIYYMSMPKPEPLQLFTLSLFFYFFKKTNWDLSSWYWIFLGLAIGAKISTLPFAMCILFFVILRNYKESQFSKDFENISEPVFFTFLGLVISIPMLIKNFIISIIFYKIVIKFIEKCKVHTANLKLLIIYL